MSRRITHFALEEGSLLAGKLVVEEMLGHGWEGEVYQVRERHTGIRRAAKLFFPQRNPRNVTVRRYAKKLNKLRRCELVIQYHHTEVIEHEDQEVTCLVSELVEGQLLCDVVKAYRSGRMPPFEALHLTYALARGLEEIHLAKEYHGDLHDKNVLVRRQGIFFRPRLVDFYNHGAVKRRHQQNDVVDLVRLLFDAVGGAARYHLQPEAIKAICCGRRNDLVRRRFPTASHLRRYLESFSWD
jgi:serine/threonine protein kinase